MPKKWPSTGFGERLKAVREGAGQSQQRLADVVGVDVMTVSRLERGGQEPTWPLVLAFCEALGVSTEAFRQGAGAGPPEQAGSEEPKQGQHRKAPADTASTAPGKKGKK
jgi:transcriptional regulator with XRE-family HTH domain